MKHFFQLYFNDDHKKFHMIFSNFIHILYAFVTILLEGTVIRLRTHYSKLNINSRSLNLALNLELH